MTRPADVLVRVPATYVNERRYAIRTLLGDHLGLEVEIEIEDRRETEVQAIGMPGSLTVSDQLFSVAPERWLQRTSLPRLPLRAWRPADDGLQCEVDVGEVPVLYGAPVRDSSFAPAADPGRLGLDVFGSAFFMLSRYVELAARGTDEHGRFPAALDVAERAGFLSRPLVDEYVEILWACMCRLWPGMRRRKHEFRQILTHDVDIPFQHAFQGPLRLARSCAADWLVRRDPVGPFRRIAEWTRVRIGRDRHADPAFTFDRIMDLADHEGLTSTFFFIMAQVDPHYDALYDHRHPWIEDLMRRIHARGHRLGLHASYGSWLDAAQVGREFAELRMTCVRLGIAQDAWGVRQHWLRIRIPDTLRIHARAGLAYDCSYAYPERIGFRGGTCRAFRPFDPVSRTTLPIVEHPTAVMDVTVLEPALMGLGTGAEACSAVLALKSACRKHGGDFVVLWHNNRLYRPGEWELFEAVVRG